MKDTKNNSEIYELLNLENYNLTVKEFIIEHMKELNLSIWNGNTLLHLAAELGNLDVIRYLIEEKKMDVNLEKKYNHRTPLYMAVQGNKDNIVEYLVQHGANVNVIDWVKNSPLHFAAKQCNVRILELLISHGANLNSKNIDKVIPLHFACSKCNFKTVKYLVDNDPSTVNAKDGLGDTPLIYAIRLDNFNMVKYFVEHGADVQVKNNEEETPLHFAAGGGKLDIVKYLVENDAAINAQSKDLFTPIHEAAKNGKTDILKYLIEIGADLNLTHKYGETVLHYAAKGGSLEMVKYLIEEKGLNVDVKDKYNETPLIFAALKGKLNIVKYLIEEKHANTIVYDTNTDALLGAATKSDSLELVKYLVEEQNVDINVKNKFGYTPLDFANDNIHKYLESRMKIRHRRSIEPFTFFLVKPNLITKLIASNSNNMKRHLSGNGNTIGHLPNSKQPLENSQFLFSVENFGFLGCIAEALNDSISKRYNFLRTYGTKVVPSNQIAVNRAREEFDQFVEKKIKNLSSTQQSEIHQELEIVGNEINESLMRGVEFSGLHGLKNVLEMCKNCFCENLLTEKK